MMDSCLRKAHLIRSCILNAYQVDDANKSAIFGMVSLTVMAQYTREERGAVSNLMLKIKGNNATKKWALCMGLPQRTDTILTDNTTKQPLLHGVVRAAFSFS